MSAQELINAWFEAWEKGNFQRLPIAEKFTHTSPYGIIKGKAAYVELVAANKDKFLGHRFEIHDEIYGEHHGCVRYTAIQGDFRLEVSEWHYVKEGLIQEIVAYYNIPGEIREDRKLKDF